MISAGDFRNGITIELEGNILSDYRIQHVGNQEKVQHL